MSLSEIQTPNVVDPRIGLTLAALWLLLAKLTCDSIVVSTIGGVHSDGKPALAEQVERWPGDRAAAMLFVFSSKV